MVKRSLIEQLVKDFPGISKTDMTAVVDSLFEALAATLAQTEAIEIRGLGRFTVRERGPINARNPKTAEALRVPSRRVVHFKPAESLIKEINR